MREQSAHENNLNGGMPSTMIYLPTGEGVTVAKYNSYRGVLTSDVLAKSMSHSKQQKKMNINDETDVHLLTELDTMNRLRGYSLFLPDNKEKSDKYWRMTYGIELQDDADDLEQVRMCIYVYICICLHLRMYIHLYIYICVYML
jgi:hypothetical protein